MRSEEGKFVEKFSEPTERISARILKSQADQLRGLTKEGETISDVVRRAIAFYLAQPL